jgi:DsbC/DsbD-like thiol-disulfide interchange protein
MKNLKDQFLTRMKKIALLAAFMVAGSFALHAQILTPVHWSYGSKKISKTEAIVFLKATIDDGWHVYSQHVKEGGPVKTTFTFDKSPDYTVIGNTVEPAPITRNEKVFGMDVSFFEKSVIFQQKVKLTKGKATVKGTLEYMTCNDQKCLPPEDIEFNIHVE